jgi:hypothetical protein
MAAMAPEVPYNRAPHCETVFERESDRNKNHMVIPEEIMVNAIHKRNPQLDPNSKNHGINHGLNMSEDGSPRTGIPNPMNEFQLRKCDGSRTACMANSAIGRATL